MLVKNGRPAASAGVGQKNSTVLIVDNFVKVSGRKACDVRRKTFAFLSLLQSYHLSKAVQ